MTVQLGKAAIVQVMLLTVTFLGTKVDAQSLSQDQKSILYNKAEIHFGPDLKSEELSEIESAVKDALERMGNQVFAYMEGKETSCGLKLIFMFGESGGQGNLVVFHASPNSNEKIFWRPASGFALGVECYKAKVFLLISGINKKTDIFGGYSRGPDLDLPTSIKDIRVDFYNSDKIPPAKFAIIRKESGTGLSIRLRDKVYFCQDEDCTELQSK